MSSTGLVSGFGCDEQGCDAAPGFVLLCEELLEPLGADPEGLVRGWCCSFAAQDACFDNVFLCVLEHILCADLLC